MNEYRHSYRSNKAVLLLLDLSIIAGSFILSNLFRHGNDLLDFQYNLFFGLFALLWCVVSGFTNFIFRIESLLSCGRKAGNLINAFLLHAAFMAACIIVFNLSGLPGLLLLYVYVSTALLIVFSRLLLLRGFSYFTRPGSAGSRFVIVGAGPGAISLLETFNHNPEAKFMGFFDDEAGCSSLHNSRILGPVERLEAYCLKHNINEVYYAKPLNNQEQVNDLAKFCIDNAVYFRLVPGSDAILEQNMNRYFYRNVPVSYPRQETTIWQIFSDAYSRVIQSI